MLEHLVVYPRGGLCNRLRAIASAKRLCARAGARCTVVWEWGDYTLLFEDETEWIPYAAPMDWRQGHLVPGYHHIRHRHPRQGGTDENRRVPTTVHSRIALTSWYVFGAAEEPALHDERDVLAWFPDPHASVLARVREFRRTHLPTPVAGIHMRRTDNKRAILRSPDEAYWKETDRLVSDGYSLFLATDNNDTTRAMQARYGARLLHYPKRSPLEIRWPRLTSEVDDVVDDFIDLWLLASCDLVVGSLSSTYSRVAILLNGSPQCRAIDLPEPTLRRRLGRIARRLHLRRDSPRRRPSAGPTALGMRAGAVQRARMRWKIGCDDSYRGAVEELLAKAQQVLHAAPGSVMDKTAAAASGDRHDFVSFAPDYWPDPTKENGLPYVHRDGQINPECYGPDSDRRRLEEMASSSETLAWAHVLSGDEAYARAAAERLRTWFVDPATRMSPHLRFAQIIRGEREGRPHGILEGQYLLPAFDAANLLEASRSWAEVDRSSLTAWQRKLLRWLRSSANGKREAGARNNHGTLYDVQIVHLALSVGDLRLARRTAQRALRRRIATQIRPDGSQPFELLRADSLHSSQYNLAAFFKLAVRAEHAGVELWHYQTRRGAGIRKGLDFLIPYLDDPPEAWPFGGSRPEPHFDRVLRQAARVYGDDRYARLADKQAGARRDWVDFVD